MAALGHSGAVGVHPRLAPSSTTHWELLKVPWASRGRPISEEQVWMLDNIAAFYNADFFNAAGRFDPALTFAWGIDIELAFRAAKLSERLVVNTRSTVEKVTNIGYKMKRMGMSAANRSRLAYVETCTVMEAKYGHRWPSVVFGGFGKSFQNMKPTPAEEQRNWVEHCQQYGPHHGISGTHLVANTTPNLLPRLGILLVLSLVALLSCCSRSRSRSLCQLCSSHKPRKPRKL